MSLSSMSQTSRFPNCSVRVSTKCSYASNVFAASAVRLSNHALAAFEKSGIFSRFVMRLTESSKSRLRACSASRAITFDDVLALSRMSCPSNRNLYHQTLPRLYNIPSVSYFLRCLLLLDFRLIVRLRHHVRFEWSCCSRGVQKNRSRRAG